MCSSASLFGTRNFKPRHSNSVLCYSNPVFSYVPRFNQQNTQKNEIKQNYYMFRQCEINVTIYKKIKYIKSILCVYCKKYFKKYTVNIRCKVILNNLVKGLPGKGLFGRPSISRRERIFLWGESSLADWLLGIPRFQSDEQGSYSLSGGKEVKV